MKYVGGRWSLPNLIGFHWSPLNFNEQDTTLALYKNGYYYTNGHVKEFRLDFSDGTSLCFTAEDIESRNINDNTFYFDRQIETSYIKLSVLSSYIGTKEAYRTNTAITEIEFF